MSLMSSLLQSLQGFSAQLVLVLMLLNHSLLLASGLVNYGARLGHFFHLSLATRMSGSKLICYFPSHPAEFGFQSSKPSDNITLNPANMKADQSLSDFQTGIGDTISSLQYSEGGVISCSEVCELLTKIQDILETAVSKQAGNTA